MAATVIPSSVLWGGLSYGSAIWPKVPQWVSTAKQAIEFEPPRSSSDISTTTPQLATLNKAGQARLRKQRSIIGYHLFQSKNHWYSTFSQTKLLRLQPRSLLGPFYASLSFPWKVTGTSAFPPHVNWNCLLNAGGGDTVCTPVPLKRVKNTFNKSGLLGIFTWTTTRSIDPVGLSIFGNSSLWY